MHWDPQHPQDFWALVCHYTLKPQASQALDRVSRSESKWLLKP